MSDFSQPIVLTPEAKSRGSLCLHKTRLHRTRRFKEPALPSAWRPVGMFVFSVAAALVCWAAYNAAPPWLPSHPSPPRKSTALAKKPLQQATASSKFNATSAKPPDVQVPELLPEPERDAPAVVHLIGEPLFVPTPEAPPEAPPVPLPQADLLKVEPPKVELPPVGSALVLAPVPPPPLPVAPPVIEPVSLTVPDPRLNRVLSADLSPLIYRETTPGDTPMLRNWQTLALCSLMTTTLVVQIPVPATAGEQAKESETALLKKRLEKLEESSKLAADAAKKINDLKVDVSLIRNELKALHELGVGSSGLDKASVEQIKSKLGDIEQAILKLAPTTSRVALSPPVPSPTGRMMLVNFYPETLLFFVNGKEYRVSPGANRLLDNVPAGVVNYYVFASGWGMQPTRTTVLSPNETFTLTAR